MTLERHTGQISDITLGLRNHIGQRIPQVLAALRIRALPYAIGIDRLTLGRRDLLLVTAIGNTITIRIQAYPVRIDRAAFRRVRLQVELVGHPVTVRIIQHRLRQLHMAGSIDLIVGIIQRVQPPQGFNRMLRKNIVVDTDRNEVVRVGRPRLGNALRRTKRIVVLPLLASSRSVVVTVILSSRARFNRLLSLDCIPNPKTPTRSSGAPPSVALVLGRSAIVL